MIAPSQTKRCGQLDGRRRLEVDAITFVSHWGGLSYSVRGSKMGGFFTIIGVDRVSRVDAVLAFRQFESSEGTPVEIFINHTGTSTVLVGDLLYDSESIVSQISKSLGVPAILLSYSDDVVWGYELFQNGGMVDRYSSRPTYWDLPEGTNATDLAGSASIVASIWTEVEECQISRYLTNKQLIPEGEGSLKAYPDDQSEQWDAWQMCDFMRKLGLAYPVDEDGELNSEAIASLTVSTANGRAQKAETDAMIAEAHAEFTLKQSAQ